MRASDILKWKAFCCCDSDGSGSSAGGDCNIQRIESLDETNLVNFRDLESEVIRDVSAESCRIISTGGGAILRKENVRCLKRNGKLFFLNADIRRLQATDDRPLSDTYEKLAKLYAERMGIYTSTADVIVPDMETPEAEAEYIITKRMERIL